MADTKVALKAATMALHLVATKAVDSVAQKDATKAD